MADGLDKKIADEIIAKLLSLEDPDKMSICIGLEAYSPREIADEIRNGTELGREFYTLHLGLIGR